MNYLVAVLPDRIQAEAAYSALENEGLPDQQVDILGNGYKSADEYGLIDPNLQARKGAKRLVYWLVPFGFVAGYAFKLLTGIEVLPVIGSLGNHLFGGVLGAASGALGAYLVGVGSVAAPEITRCVAKTGATDGRVKNRDCSLSSV